MFSTVEQSRSKRISVRQQEGAGESGTAGSAVESDAGAASDDAGVRAAAATAATAVSAGANAGPAILLRPSRAAAGSAAPAAASAAHRSDATTPAATAHLDAGRATGFVAGAAGAAGAAATAAASAGPAATSAAAASAGAAARAAPAAGAASARAAAGRPDPAARLHQPDDGHACAAHHDAKRPDVRDAANADSDSALRASASDKTVGPEQLVPAMGQRQQADAVAR